MQGPTWAPDASQWKRIRQKINQIDETKRPTQQVVPPDTQHVGYQPAAPLYEENIQFPAPPSSFERAGVNAPMPPPTNVIPAAPTAPPLERTMTPQGTEKVKTPDIDTSIGSYKSSFE